jgi:hypothetical protein
VSNSTEQPHRKHRPYERSKAKANATAAIAASAGHDDEAPFDPDIPGETVGGGDPGVAFLLASSVRPAAHRTR